MNRALKETIIRARNESISYKKISAALPVQESNIRSLSNNNEKKPVLQEQLQRELDYARAQQILEAILDKGLISLSEFNKITVLNRQSFSPALAEIMPDIR